MLPEIDTENFNKILDEMLVDIASWRKSMIHYIKDENPELNSAIIELANKTNLDPKAIASGAYMAYALIEEADKKRDEIIKFEE